MITLELDGGVATLALDDPSRRNAMTPEMGDALRAAVDGLRARRDVRAVILTGNGSAFSGGGSLKMLEQLRGASRDQARAHMLEFYGKYLSILDLEVPVIAAVKGAAMGAGLALAIACDLCVVDRAAKLAFNFAALGLFPGMGATHFLPRRAGAQRAFELLATGRTFDGVEAVEYGLAVEAVGATYVRGRARKIAEAIAESGPLAVRALKETFATDRAALRVALENEASRQAESYASEDLGEGLAAAKAKRKPAFKGA
jgi:enoyl-CoA hydratase/carnithine racemase